MSFFWFLSIIAASACCLRRNKSHACEQKNWEVMVYDITIGFKCNLKNSFKVTSKNSFNSRFV